MYRYLRTLVEYPNGINTYIHGKAFKIIDHLTIQSLRTNVPFLYTTISIINHEDYVNGYDEWVEFTSEYDIYLFNFKFGR